MRPCTRRLSLAGLAVVAGLLSACRGAGPGIAVEQMQLARQADGYYLTVELRYDLSEAMLEALHNGVPLTFRVASRAQRPRRWLWPRTLARHHLAFTVAYHTLSGQYVVHGSGAQDQRSYPTLGAALASIARISDWYLLPGPLESNARMRYGVRARLERAALPAPLRLVAFFSPAWHLDSGWHSAMVRP